MSDMFEEFWCTIPKRNRPHPKHLTRTRWDRIIKNGVKPEDLIAAAREWRKKEEELKLIGTEFVPMASTWLHQKRFLDYQVDRDYRRLDDLAAKKGYVWEGTPWNGKYVKVNGGASE